MEHSDGMKEKAVVMIVFLSLLLFSCGDGGYDEDDAYEAGYDGMELKSSKYKDAYQAGQRDSYCDWLKCAIERGDKSKSDWSGCGSWGSHYGC